MENNLGLLLRALRSKEDLFDIYIQPIKWGQTGWVWEESEFREWMDKLAFWKPKC
jgi:hypothetical protein